jgi:predicted nucleic acid-binding protein
MVIVDTSVLVDYVNATINPQTDWIDQKLGVESMGLTDLILCELLQGIRSDSDIPLVLRELSNFEIFDTGGEQLAITSALNYRSLRALGYTVRKTIDCVVATFCIREGHYLLHRDRDFDVFEQHPGLRVIHPAGQLM